MKFSELPEASKDRAREALCAVIRNGVSSASAKLAGETVAAAFIAMERHNDALNNGEGNSRFKIGDSAPK